MNVRGENISLLYIEDEAAVRGSMLEFLCRRFDRIWVAENGAEGLKTYRERSPDIVMTDIRMPVMGGLEMAREILQFDDKANIIVTSAHNESNYLLEAIQMGVNNYLLKPLEWNKVDATLQRCIEIVRKARNARDLEKSIAEANQRINMLIDYSEKTIVSSTCQSDEMERKLDQMFEIFMREAERSTSNRPTRIMTMLVRGSSGPPEWLRYEMGWNGLIQKVCCIDQPAINPDMIAGHQVLYYVNEGDRIPDDPLLRRIFEHFNQSGNKPANMVLYCNGNRVICAVNYPSPVTACDAEAVKNLAVHARYLDSILAQHHQTEEAFLYTITSLARAAEANDEDNGNHILRVGEYSAAICRRIGYSERLAEAVAVQSQLHDVGKIHVSPEILKKPGKLTDEEMVLMRDHTVFGVRIIGSHPRLESARSIALHHHERWDGTGYPSGLVGTEIPMDARIVAIADVYDALRNRRSYKPAFNHDTACRIILEGDGRTNPSHFDPDLLEAFKKIDRELEDIYESLATVE